MMNLICIISSSPSSACYITPLAAYLKKISWVNSFNCLLIASTVHASVLMFLFFQCDLSSLSPSSVSDSYPASIARHATNQALKSQRK
jgi:hypothetical protein